MIGIVGCEVFWIIEECMDVGFGQYWYVFDGSCQDWFEMIEVFRQLIEFELIWNVVYVLWFGVGFKCVEQYFFSIFFIVGIFVWYVQNWQLFQFVDLFGNDVEVFIGVKWNVDVCYLVDFVVLYVVVIDYYFGFDKVDFVILFLLDIGCVVVFYFDFCDFYLFKDFCIFQMCIFGQCKCDVCWVVLFVQWQVDCGGSIICVDMGIMLGDFMERNFFYVYFECLGY